jgi:hypothetical protein
MNKVPGELTNVYGCPDIRGGVFAEHCRRIIRIDPMRMQPIRNDLQHNPKRPKSCAQPEQRPVNADRRVTAQTGGFLLIAGARYRLCRRCGLLWLLDAHV